MKIRNFRKTLSGYDRRNGSKNEIGIVLKSKELISELAIEEHRKWARFMRYIFSKCDRDKSGNFILPAKYVYKWIKQGVSQFDALEEKEKENYNIEARKTLQIISRHFLNAQDDK